MVEQKPSKLDEIAIFRRFFCKSSEIALVTFQWLSGRGVKDRRVK